jgi:hypothetical protein
LKLSKRHEAALKLYKEGSVRLDLADDDLWIFTITGNDDYTVAIKEDYLICNCDDYQYRSGKWPGSYLCKHSYAALFMFMEAIKI